MSIFFLTLSFQLDILSREDLVKFIKKQTVTLQKTRSQCESKFIIFLNFI